ncbi:helix-turn-helix domain-containing protein [Nocardia sp. NPDC058658]|uniref:MmyB family transcriptional regulator n=1 Tax=Nocardia sp. NPDC058658 TaxID=3346580 RepID=UPI003660DC1A
MNTEKGQNGFPTNDAIVAVPSFSATCKRIRENRNLSRAEAKRWHGISPTQLFRYEAGTGVPPAAALDTLIAGYRLGAPMERHLRELRDPALPLASIAALREHILTRPGAAEYLAGLDTRGILAAYIDPMFNVLAANSLLHAALIDLDDFPSIPRWIFSQPGRTTLIDHAHEADQIVARLRAETGRFRVSEQAADVVRYLGADPEFARRWLTSSSVAYGRDANDLVHVRTPNGNHGSYRLAFSEIDPVRHIHLVTAVPE